MDYVISWGIRLFVKKRSSSIQDEERFIVIIRPLVII
jgi:hypothetical protein